jgi:hypothetical protein
METKDWVGLFFGLYFMAFILAAFIMSFRQWKKEQHLKKIEEIRKRAF